MTMSVGQTHSVIWQLVHEDFHRCDSGLTWGTATAEQQNTWADNWPKGCDFNVDFHNIASVAYFTCMSTATLKKLHYIHPLLQYCEDNVLAAVLPSAVAESTWQKFERTTTVLRPRPTHRHSDSAKGFSLSSFCILIHLLFCVNQLKMLVTVKYYHMLITANVCVNRMATGMEKNTGK
jgi:hypothetical protein